MKDATLIIMAAGMGSRYSGGIKQLETVGPNGELIIDYSIYDALNAGFNKVIFVIRREIERDFKDIIGKRVEAVTNVSYVYQEIDDIPDKYKDKFIGRIKPWGTGQAILCCKSIVNEPFLVINADDYYGKGAYKEAYEFLQGKYNESESMNACMVGFALENTLSEHGTVTRGICQISDEHTLLEIEETYGLYKKDGIVKAKNNGKDITVPLDSEVSMNIWGFTSDFFLKLEKGFSEFLEVLEPEDNETEYLLPQIVRELLLKKEINVKVLESQDKWFGVTYKEDKEKVRDSIRELICKGMYPEKIN